MPKTVLDDRPIWPVAPTEPPHEAAQADPDTGGAPSGDEAPQQSPRPIDSFEGFGSFSG